MHIARLADAAPVHPLKKLSVLNVPGAKLLVLDGDGNIYESLPAASEVSFTVGGALGRQTLRAVSASGKIVAQANFQVDAQTSIEENTGTYSGLYKIAQNTMRSAEDDGVGTIAWRGRVYHYFDPWILDHSNTSKGMQYLSPWVADMVDLFGAAQKSNGMIWSFAFPDPSPQHQYHYWAYKDQGYAWSDDKVLFARQPVENHNEANFVDTLYLAWKGSGNDAWMESHLHQAERALDYSITDPARWSTKYRLLKRGYTIDSWDFQPDDKYLVHFAMGSAQQIDPTRTKFVIFFGDNTGYAHACDQLAEMLQHAGRDGKAAELRQRAEGIRERLNALAWNDHFYTQHIEIDPTVHRELGVDERMQLAMSNMYSLNRGVTQQQAAAIIQTYENLRGHLPPGAPGEWYAVYPPYGKGFGAQDAKWQYMNGGVQTHAAGELARGALEHGFESYGANILARLDALGHKYNGKLYFAYTGAFEPSPPPASYQPVDISEEANMSLLDHAGPAAVSWMHDGNGNDMRNLPTGSQTIAGIPFHVPQPGQSSGPVAAATSIADKSLPEKISIPIRRKAAAIDLLHAVTKTGPSNIGGVLRFEYADGTSRAVYLEKGKHFGSTWFPSIDSSDAGVAWWGANGLCGDVGVYWAAIANPLPEKTINRLVFSGSQDGSIYALLGVSLADRMPWHEANPISYGGPDNWSGGLVADALTEGLAGIRDQAAAFRSVELSPRWVAAKVKHARVTVRYPASTGYVSYEYWNDPATKTLRIVATGNAHQCGLHLLLPYGVFGVKQVRVDGKLSSARLVRIEKSTYVVLPISLTPAVEVKVRYE